VNSLARNMQIMSYVGGAQTIISTLKLESPLTFAKVATSTQLSN
jgi:hypothetical protein